MWNSYLIAAISIDIFKRQNIQNKNPAFPGNKNQHEC